MAASVAASELLQLLHQELRRAADKNHIAMKTTNGKHLSNSPLEPNGSFTIVKRDINPMESEQVNIDTEMAKMMKNNLLNILKKKLKK